MYYVVETICVIVELIFVYIFSRSLFEEKKVSHTMQFFSYAIFGLLLLFLSFVPNASIIRILYTLIGVALLIYFFSETRFLHALFASFVFCALYTLTDLLVLGLFSITELDPQKIIYFGTSRSVYLIATHIFLLGFIVLSAIASHRHYGMISIKTLLPFLPCWGVSILLCCLLVVSVYQTDTDLHPLYAVVALGLLITNIVIIVFTDIIRKQELLQYEHEISEHHYVMQKSYYEQVFTQQEEVHAIWHDIDKYLRALKAESQNIEFSPSWDQIQTTLNDVTSLVDVNNSVLNIILNEYVALAKTAQTQLNLNVHVPKEIAVTAVDLYIIIGNTLDNALEACNNLPKEKRIIDVMIKMHNDILYYQVTNFYASEITPKKNKQLSSQHHYHGYGLANVKKSVAKYNGTLTITKGSSTHEISILLNLS